MSTPPPEPDPFQQYPQMPPEAAPQQQGYPQQQYQYPPPPAGYPPPPYGYVVYGPPQKTNGFAVASLVLGILWVYWIGSILALIFGYVARQQIRERGESGDGMAIAGIVLGWVGVGVLAIVLIVVAVGASNGFR